MTDFNTSQQENHNESSGLAKRVLTKIEYEHLTPSPRWKHFLHNGIFWSAVILATIIAAFAATAAIFVFTNTGWEYATITHNSVLAFLLASLPWLWLMILAFFVFAGYWNIRHTRYGYRYRLPLVVIGLVFVVLLVGSALFAAGFGQTVEEGIGSYMPFYRPFLNEEQSWWSRADHGLLIGTITSVSPDFSSFTLRTKSGKIWFIDASDLRTHDITILARGGMVRIVGVAYTATSTRPFHACFVLPWQIYGKFPEPLNAPLAALTASTSEIISHNERSEVCRGIHPYRSLRALDGHQ